MHGYCSFAFNILIIYDSLLFFSLSSPSTKLTHSLPHHIISSSDTHTLTNTKSKINYKNKKLTTKSTTKSTTGTKSLDQLSVIVDHGLERWFGSVMEIGVDGDRWWVDGDQCWWSACDGASGFWPWEKEEERRERGNDRDIRKKKEEV